MTLDELEARFCNQTGNTTSRYLCDVHNEAKREQERQSDIWRSV
jgi:hypothetical protein